MNKILIPTDFSSNSYNAIRYAVSLFDEESCEFIILHTFYLSGMDQGNLLIPEPSKKEKAEAEERANRNIKNLEMRMTSESKKDFHSFRFLVEFAPLFETLKKTVERENIDLIIMGTQGQSDKKSAILGSNAVNAMEKIRACPVMAIPASVSFKNPNEIVFPTSFRNHYKPKELKILVQIAKITQAPIRILHVLNQEKLSEQQLENKRFLEEIPGEAVYTHHTLYDVDVNDGISAFLQSRESEMMAFINKKHSFFGSIFSNPMVKELGMQTKVPLLAMHDKRE